MDLSQYPDPNDHAGLMLSLADFYFKEENYGAAFYYSNMAEILCLIRKKFGGLEPEETQKIESQLKKVEENSLKVTRKILDIVLDWPNVEDIIVDIFGNKDIADLTPEQCLTLIKSQPDAILFHNLQRKYGSYMDYNLKDPRQFRSPYIFE